MYTLSGRSCPLNVIFEIVAWYLQQPQLTVNSKAEHITCLQSIQRGQKKTGQLTTTGQI